jgi:hypothetical protein
VGGGGGGGGTLPHEKAFEVVLAQAPRSFYKKLDWKLFGEHLVISTHVCLLKVVCVMR